MSADEVILTIDQGTSQTKALLVDRNGRVRASAASKVPRTPTRPDWAEVDPFALLKSVEHAAAECFATSPKSVISAVAVTNQRESVVAWRRSTGEPVGPCVLWQCRRTQEMCAELRREGKEPWIRERTGLGISSMFSAAKARWLLDHRDPAIAADDVLVGTVDSWLVWNLTGGRVHASDVSNASRTQLLNIRTLQWDDDLLDLFGVPRSALPAILPSNALFGETAGRLGIPAGIPIAGVLGDSHASLFGQGGWGPGRVKVTYGTGSSILSVIEAARVSDPRLALTVAWGLGDAASYAIEANILVSGAVAEWLASLLSGETHGDAKVVFEMASRGSRDHGVHVVPAFFGLGAPYWEDGARGLITGLGWGTTANDIARAAVDAIAHQVGDVLTVVEGEQGSPISAIYADGGAAANDDLMQFQADLCGRPVIRSDLQDVSALGAAYVAGMSVGWWPSFEALERLARPTRTFEPMMSEVQRDELRGQWERAVAQCLAGIQGKEQPHPGR